MLRLLDSTCTFATDRLDGVGFGRLVDMRGSRLTGGLAGLGMQATIPVLACSFPGFFAGVKQALLGVAGVANAPEAGP